MIRKPTWLITLLAIAFSLAACNTIEGAGKDIEKAGEEVQEAAEGDDDG